MEQLALCLSQTTSPDRATRQAAEAHLKAASATPQFSHLMLQLLSSADPNVDANIKQIAAIFFKNLIRTGYDEESGVIPNADKPVLKDNLVMILVQCTSQPVKKQLGEAISTIAAADYPTNWPDLMPSLVSHFSTNTPSTLNNVLYVLTSLLKRYTFVTRNDTVLTSLQYTLKTLQTPYLALLTAQASKLLQGTPNPAELPDLLESLKLLCEVYFSLNWLELPEYFEDEMDKSMTIFQSLLQYTNPALASSDDSEGPVEAMKCQIIACLEVYASKDEEPFQPFLQPFTTIVWGLLTQLPGDLAYDNLTTGALGFLTSIVSKPAHAGIFGTAEVIGQIVGQIVLRNVGVRESDVEKYDEDPGDYIVADFEGSDTGSRKKCSIELLKSLNRSFTVLTTPIVMEHVTKLLADYNADKANKWQNKDAALSMITAIAVIRESNLGGVTETNSAIDVVDVFSNLVLPELNSAPNPMLTAAAVRFVITFRNQFGKQHYGHIVPLLIGLLTREDVVVHTYAAAALERIFTVKLAGEGVYGRADIQPHLTNLFNNLFVIVANDEPENEYVMKCVMRSLAIIGEDVIVVTEMLTTKLTTALGIVCKNPMNPHFNHYLFESIAVLVKNVCGSNPEYVNSFEPLLFPPFQHVLQEEVTEFIPYVFQVLAQLLEYRGVGVALSASYVGLFPPLLTPTLWESKGNVPALTRLIVAYVNKGGMGLLGSGNNLMGVLGVFQKLISSRANEGCGFQVMTGLLEHVGLDAIAEQVGQVMQILLMRLQSAKTAKFCRHLTLFFAFFAGKFGAARFLQILNGIQPGLGVMILGVYAKAVVVDGAVFNRLDSKVVVVGTTALLAEAEIMQGAMDSGSLWGNLVVAVVKLLQAAGLEKNDEENDETMEETVSFDSAFSKLNFASSKAVDKFGEVQDFQVAFVQKLQGLCAAQPGRLLPLATGELAKADGGKFSTVLQEVCAKYNVQLQ